jgi:thiol-disulfide isomerase/thioredoxin
MRWSGTLAVGLLVASCATTGSREEAKTTVVSFTELDCSKCGDDMARALITEEGVFKTAFDKKTAELTVVAVPSIDVVALARSKKPADEKWSLVPGAGKGAYVAGQAPKAGLDVKQVAVNGEDVADLAPHLAQGKVTIVDFSAKWCEPCRTLDEKVLAMLEARPGLAYRKLDIGDWDTPLAKRYLTGVKELPYVRVYDASGRQVEALSGLDMAKLEAAVTRASETK